MKPTPARFAVWLSLSYAFGYRTDHPGGQNAFHTVVEFHEV